MLIAATAAIPSPAAAAPIAPTGKWVVDFAEAQCVAHRNYGADQLFVKASPMGDVLQIGIVRRAGHARPMQVTAEFRPAMGEPFRGNAMSWSPRGSGRHVTLVNMPVSDFQRLSSAPSWMIRLDERRWQLAITGMEALAKVMKTCVDDLQAVWEVDPSDGLQPKANLASLIKDDEYPDEMVRREVGGTTAFALLVNEEGRVADCMVTATSGQAMLDTQSCAIVKERARFTPAKTTDGKPRKGRVTSRITWRIE